MPWPLLRQETSADGAHLGGVLTTFPKMLTSSLPPSGPCLLTVFSPAKQGLRVPWRSWHGCRGGQGSGHAVGAALGTSPSCKGVPQTAVDMVVAGRTHLALLELLALPSLQGRHKYSCTSCELQHRLAPPAMAPCLLCARLSPWRRKPARIVNLYSVLWLTQPGGFPHL